VAALTREHVTVALNGDGGDESFAGYYSYYYNSFASRLDRLPLWMRRLGATVGERLPTSGDDRSTLSRARRLSSALALDGPTRFARYMSCFHPAERERLYTDDYRAQLGDSTPERLIRDAWHGASGAALLDVMLEVDIGTWLHGDLIPKMDIATMAHGLEARSPLLDQELMQMAASIPAELKMPGNRKKGLLRDALRPWLPAQAGLLRADSRLASQRPSRVRGRDPARPDDARPPLFPRGRCTRPDGSPRPRRRR
jgi:asparagine synthase (glutamine-hydrolysing)